MPSWWSGKRPRVLTKPFLFSSDGWEITQILDGAKQLPRQPHFQQDEWMWFFIPLGFSIWFVFLSIPPHEAEMRPDSSSGNYKPDYIKQKFNKIIDKLVRLYMVCYYMVKRTTLVVSIQLNSTFLSVFLAVVE